MDLCSQQILCSTDFRKLRQSTTRGIKKFKTKFYFIVIIEDIELSHGSTIYHKKKRVNLQSGLGAVETSLLTVWSWLSNSLADNRQLEGLRFCVTFAKPNGV